MGKCYGIDCPISQFCALWISELDDDKDANNHKYVEGQGCEYFQEKEKV